MADLEIRSVEGLAGSAVPYAYAVKAGPWLFLTGHEAYDFATGSAPDVDGPAGFPAFGAPRLKREAQYILARMRKTLAEFGSDFKHSVRVDQYYPMFEAVRAYQPARHGEFGDYIPPSTSVLMERLFRQSSHISMSLVGVVPHKDYEIAKLYPKEVPVPVGSFFVPAITCNDFVMVAGQMASDENALDQSVRLPKEVRNWGGPNAVRRQTEFVIKKRLEPALKAGDASWQGILKAARAAQCDAIVMSTHGRGGRFPLRGFRRAARQLLEEVSGAVTHTGDLLVQCFPVHPAFRLGLKGPGDPAELLGKRQQPLLHRIGGRRA